MPKTIESTGNLLPKLKTLAFLHLRIECECNSDLTKCSVCYEKFLTNCSKLIETSKFLRSFILRFKREDYSIILLAIFDRYLDTGNSFNITVIEFCDNYDNWISTYLFGILCHLTEKKSIPEILIKVEKRIRKFLYHRYRNQKNCISTKLAMITNSVKKLKDPINLLFI